MLSLAVGGLPNFQEFSGCDGGAAAAEDISTGEIPLAVSTTRADDVDLSPPSIIKTLYAPYFYQNLWYYDD